MTNFDKLQSFLPELYELSIFSLLYTKEEFETRLEQMEVYEYEEGQIIANEGDLPQGLMIPLTGKIEIFSKSFEDSIASGTIQPYRSVNTYAALRNIPFHYSVRFKEAGALLIIPRSEILERLKFNPEATKYLLEVTENIDIRTLAKSIESIGCSQQFKIHFIANLDFHSFPPQHWLLQHKETPQKAYYFFEGQIISQQRIVSADKVAQWPIPCRKWSLWKDTLEQRQSTIVLKTTAKTTAVSLSFEKLVKLKENFPEDFDILCKSINDGVSTDHEAAETSEEFNIEQLFKQSTVPKRSFFKSWPWVPQADLMDCGPACMAMISQYFGRNVTLQFWRHSLSTNREGTSLFDLAYVSEKNGFVSSALGVDDILTVDRRFLPFIAVRQNHYLVVYEIKNNELTLGDPAYGIVKMPLQEFNDGFEQAILVLKPNEAFYDLPQRSYKYAHYFALIYDFKMELSLSVLISFMMILLGLGSPFLTQIFMDDVLVRRDLSLMWLTFTGGIILALVTSFLGWSKTYYQNYLGTKLDYKISSLLVQKMLSLPFKFYSERHVGDIVTRFHELEKLKHFLVHSSESVILSFFSIIVYGTVLFFYSPLIAVAVLCSMPIFVVISWFTGRKLTVINQEIFKNKSDTESTLNDMIKGISVIKSLGGELASRWRYQEKLVKVLKSERNYEMSAESLDVVFTLYAQIVQYSLMGLSVYLAIQGNLTPGQVIATTMLANHMFSPLLHIADQFGELQQVFSVFDRLNDIFFTPSENSAKRGQIKKDTLLGEIEFKDVWFKYGGEGSDWVLRDLNFKIEAGAKLAIVGPSGSGKSTIAGLLTRMYEPTKGQIFIDGRDYLDYDVNWLREKVGILYQESQLFGGSVAENIAFSNPDIDMSHVIAVSQKANSHEFIEKKPGGYNYNLSHGGMGLSGGEKQRVALARTFYKNPTVVLLDEATSALDGEAESTLLKNLTESTKKLTVINIAHRYSTILTSDLVFVLVSGKMVGFGSHNELAQSNDTYQKLFPESKGARVA